MKKLHWPESRLENLFDSYAYLNNDNKTKAYAAWINPEDFLRATTPLAERASLELEARPLNIPKLNIEVQEIYLKGDLDHERGHFVVTGHEGRHRMMALRNAGYDRVPVSLYMGRGFESSPVSGLYATPQRHNHDTAERGFLIGKMIPISWAHRDELKALFFDASPTPRASWESTEETGNGKTIARNFADWFGLSHVVTPDGHPLVAHHCGTFSESEGETLRVGPQGMHFGTAAAAESRDIGKRVDDFIVHMVVEEALNEEGRPSWFWRSEGIDSGDIDPDGFETEAQARANGERFAMEQEFSDTEPMPITQAYLRIENPKRVPDQGKDWTDAIAQAKAEGHDGIVYRNVFEDKGSDSYIVFRASQVKSVNNTGLFLQHSTSVRDDVGQLELDRANRAMMSFVPKDAHATKVPCRPLM